VSDSPRAIAVGKLKDARAAFEEARAQVSLYSSVTTPHSISSVTTSCASGDALLCAACDLLGVASPSATLIPSLSVYEDLMLGASVTLRSRIGVWWWLRNRLHLVERLIALHRAPDTDSGPYR
jgi:hypothetical protein